MKIITTVISLLVAIGTVSFAISNRQLVTVSLWPIPFELTLPLVFLIIIISVMVFLLGWFLSWFRCLTVKRTLKKENKKTKKQIELLEAKIKELQNQINESHLAYEPTKIAKHTSVFFG